MRYGSCLLVVSLVTVSAIKSGHADTVYVFPPPIAVEIVPHVADGVSPIRPFLSIPPGNLELLPPQLARSGSTFYVTFRQRGGIAPGVQRFTVELGALPGGSYRLVLQVFDASGLGGPLVFGTAFFGEPASISTLSGVSVSLLTLAFALIGSILLARSGRLAP
jgi:hypothetical protein